MRSGHRNVNVARRFEEVLWGGNYEMTSPPFSPWLCLALHVTTPSCLLPHKAARPRACAPVELRHLVDNRCTTTQQPLAAPLLDHAHGAPLVALRRASLPICTLNIFFARFFFYPDRFQPQRKCLFRPSASTSGSPLRAGNYSGKRKPSGRLPTASTPANPAERREAPIRRSSPLLGHRLI